MACCALVSVSAARWMASACCLSPNSLAALRASSMAFWASTWAALTMAALSVAATSFWAAGRDRR